MPEAAIWVLVALAVLFVGFAIPVLVQLRQTLKVAEDTLNSTGRRLDEALGKLSFTLEQVNRASSEMEHGVRRLASLLEALGGMGDALAKVRTSVGSATSIAMSLGSVVVGAMKAAFGRHDASRDPDPETMPAGEEVPR